MEVSIRNCLGTWWGRSKGWNKDSRAKVKFQSHGCALCAPCGRLHRCAQHQCLWNAESTVRIICQSLWALCLHTQKMSWKFEIVTDTSFYHATVLCLSPSPCEDVEEDVILEDRTQPFQIHHQNIGLTSQPPQLWAVDVYDFKITKFVEFSHEGQAEQDMHSSRVVMLL
jgi:hypothetical protein